MLCDSLSYIFDAKTDENIYPENEYRMSGNRIDVRTLDLDGDFDMIREQLDGIALSHFAQNAEMAVQEIKECG